MSSSQPAALVDEVINKTFLKTGLHHSNHNITVSDVSALTSSAPLRPIRTSVLPKEAYRDYHEKKVESELNAKLGHVVPTSPEWIYDIKYMTFSGGGVKGYAYAGILLTLDDAFRKRGKNLYSQLKGISGTSIGAMFALYMVMGIRGRALIKEVMETDVSHIIKDIDINNLMEMYGLNIGLKIRHQVYDFLERHTGKGDITFKELYELTQKQYVCCVTNVTMCKPEYHSYLTTPNYKVFESVVASMTIPLIIVPILINGHYYVDGGITDNCPFSVFPPDENFMVNTYADTPDFSSIQNYMLRITYIAMLLYQETRFRALHPEHQKRKFQLYVDEAGITDFNVDVPLKRRLILRGVREMEKFLNPNTLLKNYMNLITKILFCKVFENNSKQQNTVATEYRVSSKDATPKDSATPSNESTTSSKDSTTPSTCPDTTHESVTASNCTTHTCSVAPPPITTPPDTTPYDPLYDYVKLMANNVVADSKEKQGTPTLQDIVDFPVNNYELQHSTNIPHVEIE